MHDAHLNATPLRAQRNARLDAELHKLRASQRNTSEPTLMVEVASLKAKNDELVNRLHRCPAYIHVCVCVCVCV